MTRQRLLTIAVALLLLLNLATVYLLLRGAGHRHGGPGEHRPREIVIDRLALSAEQVKAYDELIADHRASIARQEDAMRSARADLFAGIGAQDVPAREALIARISGLQAGIERTHAEHFARLHALCTQAQQARFDDLMRELADHFGRRPPPGPRP